MPLSYIITLLAVSLPSFPHGTDFFLQLHSTLNRDPVVVSKAYTPDSIWRNRDCFLQGTDAIVAFLTSKWEKEQGYRLRKELFAWTGNKIAVQVGLLLFIFI